MYVGMYVCTYSYSGIWAIEHALSVLKRPFKKGKFASLQGQTKRQPREK